MSIASAVPLNHWAEWQKRHQGVTLDPEMMNIPLAPFGAKVSDVLDITKLGYQYEPK